jgi:hypothetical protein
MAKFNNLHRQNITKMAVKMGIEADKLDSESIWDSSLTANENYNIVRKSLELLSQKPPEHDKDEAKHIEALALAEERAYLRDQQAKDFEDIKNSTTPDLERFYLDIEDILDILLKSREIHSLILLGDGGLGKTFKTIQVLANNGVEFVFYNGNVSALELYHILYQNRKNKILCFDDTQALLNNKTAMSLLLSALYSPSNHRIVEWHTTSEKLKVPPIFEFESKVVFIANEIPANLQPLISRCFNYELSFTYNEILLIMMEIAKLPHEHLSKAQRFEVVEWLRANTDETTEDFNLRLQQKVELVYLYKNERWKELSQTFVRCDEMLKVIKQILETTGSAKDQIKKFQDITGRGRTQFYVYKAQLKCLV